MSHKIWNSRLWTWDSCVWWEGYKSTNSQLQPTSLASHWDGRGQNSENIRGRPRRVLARNTEEIMREVTEESDWLNLLRYYLPSPNIILVTFCLSSVHRWPIVVGQMGKDLWDLTSSYLYSIYLFCSHLSNFVIGHVSVQMGLWPFIENWIISQLTGHAGFQLRSITAGMKTQEDYPATNKIVVKKDWKTTLHVLLLPDYATDVG